MARTRFSIFGKSKVDVAEPVPMAFVSNEDLRHSVSHRSPFALIAGISYVVNEPNTLRDDTNFDNDFELFDELLKLNPELNDARRAVSLINNN